MSSIFEGVGDNPEAEEVKVGEIHNARVKRVSNSEVFCEIISVDKKGVAHRQEGVLQISELAHIFGSYVAHDIKIGDVIPVKVIEIDEQGRIHLSKKYAP